MEEVKDTGGYVSGGAIKRGDSGGASRTNEPATGDSHTHAHTEKWRGISLTRALPENQIWTQKKATE